MMRAVLASDSAPLCAALFSLLLRTENGAGSEAPAESKLVFHGNRTS